MPLYYNYQRDERTPERCFATTPFRRSPFREAYEGLRIILCKSQAALMLARPYIEEERRTWVASRVTQRKGCVDDGSGALAHERGRGAYMNVKISLKLSRTSSAPREVPVE